MLAGDEVAAYPLSVVRAHGGVVNDCVGGEEIVILSYLTEASHGALAFSRVCDGRKLVFVPGPAGAFDATGSAWTPDGQGVSGPLAGSRLRFVASHVSEWYIWPAHFPDLRLVTEEDLVDAKRLIGAVVATGTS